MTKAPVPAMLRRQVDSWADTWLEAKFSRLLDCVHRFRVPSTIRSLRSRSGAARPATSTSATALGVAGQRTISSFGTRA